jgi:transposase
VRTKGSPAELEWRRTLAVQRVLEGYSVEEAAEFLGVNASSVRRWRLQFHTRGWRGLSARSVSGRPPRLSCTQEKIVRRWLTGSATEHGFVTELWTAPRLSTVMAEEFGVTFHPDYLGVWLRHRGYTPQKPQRVARERDPERIAAWLAHDWPRIKKKPLARRQPWP